MVYVSERNRKVNFSCEWMVVNRLNSFKQPYWQRWPLQIITTIHKQFPAGETRVEIDFFNKVISSTKYEWNLVREKIWNLNEMLNDSDVDKWEQKIRYRSRELLFQYFVHQQQVAVWRRTGGCWGSGFILIGDQVETGVISRFKVRDGNNVYHPSPKIHIRQIEARTDISGEIFQRKSFG